MRAEAQKQAAQLGDLMQTVSSLSLAHHAAQIQKITDDSNIPKGTRFAQDICVRSEKHTVQGEQIE